MEKELTPYEIYRNRIKEAAAALPSMPSEIPQNILWLKGAAIEKIEEIDKATGDKICTFRVQDGKEFSLSAAMKGDKPYKFGFTEQYVNALMWYAYEAGRKSREDEFKRSTADMDKTLKDIADLLYNAGYIDND
jgi:hypothetical protein